jgi:4-amino-4-deoxy-L-arabinose transferase-like glycosyltransferase
MGVAGPLLAGWSVVNILVFVPATNVYVRYVLTALPALTILLAVALTSLDRDIVRRHLQRLLVVAIVFAVPLVVVVLAVSAPLIDPLAVSALVGTLAVATIALVVASRSKALVVPVVALALLPAGTLLTISPSISAFAMPDIASVISAELKKSPDVSDARIVFLDAHREAVKTQVYERRTEPFEQINGNRQAVVALMAADNADRPDIIVTRKKDLANELSDFGYEIIELRGGWRDVDWDVLVDAIRQGTIRETRERSADRAYLAFRPS